MKNLAIPVFVLLVFQSFGQTGAPGRHTEDTGSLTEAPGNKNELRLNLVYSLLEVPEVSYERILGTDQAVGVSLGFAINEEIDYRLLALPYYRFYFGNGYASGFFLELNTILGTMRDYTWEPSGLQNSSEFAFGIGVATGVKFLANNAWSGEVTLGLGRYLGDAGREYWFYPRFGISLGRRF